MEGIVGPEEGRDASVVRDAELHDSTRETYRSDGDCQPIDWHTAGFHDIIGKSFQHAGTDRVRDAEGGSYQALIIQYKGLDIEKGEFLEAIHYYYSLVSRAVLPYTYILQLRHRLNDNASVGGPGGDDRGGPSTGPPEYGDYGGYQNYGGAAGDPGYGPGGAGSYGGPYGSTPYGGGAPSGPSYQ